MRSSTITLYIDTTSSILIAGIVKDNKLVSEIKENLGKDLSTHTLYLIEKMFKEVELDVNDIDRIVVVNGPGSFTGIRIGITIAKTYSWALNKEITTISSLEAMSISSNTDKFKIPYIDARRGYVYAGIYDSNNNIVLENQYIELSELIEKANKLNKPYQFISNDDLISSEIYNADILKIVTSTLNKESINPHAVNPIYLKKTEAEESKGLTFE